MPAMSRKDNKFENNQLPTQQYQELIPARPASIPVEQWELPAGFKEDGSFASLAEVVADPIPTWTLEDSAPDDKKNLILKRLKLQNDYPPKYVLGIGLVDRDRAISEVDADTPAGIAIQESEQRVIQTMREEAYQSFHPKD